MQVHGKKVDLKFINNIHKKILQGITPNIVFVLKVSKEFLEKIKKEKVKTDMIIFQSFIIRHKNRLLNYKK